MPVTPFTDFVAENEEGLTTFSRKPFSFNDLLLAPRVGLEPTTNRLTDVLVAWPFRAETVRVVGCYGNPMRLASTVVRLRALAKNHGNSELARVQFGRIRKRNRPVPRGAPASQWRKVLAGTPARRASSARDSLASPRNVRRCPPKLVARPRCPAPAYQSGPGRWPGRRRRRPSCICRGRGREWRGRQPRAWPWSSSCKPLWE